MWEGRADYSRKLVGSLLVAIGVLLFFKQSFSWLVFIGAFLFFEHYFVWNRWDFFDYLIGHEWWALYLMGLGFIINGSILSLIVVVVGFLLGATYERSNPFKLLIPTIKELFKIK